MSKHAVDEARARLHRAGVLIVGLWANWQGWWQAACIVALVEVPAFYGMHLDEENRQRGRDRELSEQEREDWT
jgi:hypothetical protein